VILFFNTGVSILDKNGQPIVLAELYGAASREVRRCFCSPGADITFISITTAIFEARYQEKYRKQRNPYY
jgi:hypothetical protein